MDKVRMGVVGAGGMGQGHCGYLRDLDVGELTAVCDVVPEVAEDAGERHKVPYFTKHRDLMDSGLVDAVLIATPHYFHPPIAIDAFKRGLHVLSEKPIAVSVKEASRMIRAAERSGKIFGVMFQMRHTPEYQAARKLVETGRLGEIYRVSMIMADYRSQAYYDSGGWRATWAGEGGGVLLNQAPHLLDIFTWLGGMPKVVTGQTRTRLHRIEVEDEASAVLEYANGAHGYLYASVIDAPASTRIEICGDKGKILLESPAADGQTLKFWEIKPSLSKFTVESKEMWDAPGATRVEVPLRKTDGSHAAVTRNFCRAILYGEELVTPGAEGIWSLELANAMILSHYRKKAVRIPVKRGEYEELLAELRAKSKPKKGLREQRVMDKRFEKKR